METTVALLQTTPETVLEDTRRVMALAGLDAGTLGAAPAVVGLRPAAGGFPGTGTGPWLLDGVLAALAGGTDPDATPTLFAVTAGRGPVGRPPLDRAWSGILERHGARPASAADLTAEAGHPATSLPALGAVLGGHFSFPRGLRGRPTLLLPTAALRAGWTLAGAGALLQALAARQRPRRGRIPVSEVRAESIAWAREQCGPLGVVLDGTVWTVIRGGGPWPVPRHVLLAGRDPVAVDATALRLAGLDPRTVPWLRLCAERGLGAVAAGDIHLAGQAELMELDFQIPSASIAASRSHPLERLLWRLFRRPRLLQQHRRTGWGRLEEAYRSGRPTSEAG